MITYDKNKDYTYKELCEMKKNAPNEYKKYCKAAEQKQDELTKKGRRLNYQF